MKEFKNAVYIGRFQPFHNAHKSVVEHGLEIADNVTIIVGSANSAPNIKNPWSFDQRAYIIKCALEGMGQGRVKIVSVRDYFYNELAWIAEIQGKTAALGIEDDERTALLGNFKDSSSYYLKFFPQWDFVSTFKGHSINATDIREAIFNQPDVRKDWEGKANPTPTFASISDDIAPSVLKYLQMWARNPGYMDLVEEYRYIQNYRETWKGTPFPVQFNTTDAVVTCSGHVLVIRRKINPGKGLLALPGGFLNPKETIQNGMLRELKEETGIRVPKVKLESCITSNHTFDHPDRSLRGRTITHAYHIELPDGQLPEVKGADDASQAFWIPVMDVAKEEENFYEDHAQIIQRFVGVIK